MHHACVHINVLLLFHQYYINTQLDSSNLGILDVCSSPDENNLCPLDSGLIPGRLLPFALGIQSYMCILW